MEAAIRAFFDRYEHLFNGALAGEAEMDDVAWTAIYARKDDGPDIVIDFDVHYFVQLLDGEPKVFGWVSGDEDALLKRHGVA